MPLDPRIQELFHRWEEAHQRGQDLSLQELCRDCPELIPEIERRIRAWNQRSLEIHNSSLFPPDEAAANVPNPIAAEAEKDQTDRSIFKTDPNHSKSSITPDHLGAKADQLWLNPGAEPVAGYRLAVRLGGGASGEVWKAVGPGGFSVAMKFIRLGDRAEALEVRSLEFMKEIRHAHLLALFGAWQTNGMLVIAMELADRTLMQRLEEAVEGGQTGIPLPELIGYLHDAAEGIDFLNEPCHHFLDKPAVSIQHRDIKPQNLLLIGSTVKVADFGLAKLLDHSVISNTGGLTVAYAAPEFFEGKTFNRSDQYSLAVTYCQLRGGRLPFTGIQAQIMAGHLMQRPDLSMVPEKERPIVARAMSKRPEERWPSCRVFVRELENVYAHDQHGASPDLIPVPEVPTLLSQQGKRRPLRTMALGTVVALGVTGGLALALVLQATGVLNRLREYVGLQVATLPPEPTHPEPTHKEPVTTTPGPRATEAATTKAPAATRPDPAPPTKRDPPPPPVKTNRELAMAEIQKGLEALGRKKWDDALACFSEAIRLDPEPFAPHVGRARAFFGKKDYAQAAGACAEAIRRGAKDESVYLLQTDISLARHDYDQAIADADKLLTINAEAPAAFTRRGIAWYYKHDFDQAVADLTQAIRREPENALAFAYRAGARTEKEEDAQALNDCEEALRFDPTQGMAKVCRGWLFFKYGKIDQALSELDKVALEQPELADVYQARAKVYRLRGRLDKASADIAEALRLNPKLVHAHIGLAMVHFKKGEVDKALAAVEQAIDLIPNSSLGYFARGIIHKNRDPEKAAADFAEALRKSNPKDAGDFYNRGLIYLTRAGKGDADAALKDFQTAAEKNPDLAEAFNQMGNLYVEHEQYPQAIDKFNRARELCPEKAEYVANLGTVYSWLKDYPKAIEYFDKAIQLDKTNPKYLEKRRDAYERKGDKAKPE